MMNDLKKKKIVALLMLMICFVLSLSGCIKPTTYMVEMGDGVHLATDVYVPRHQDQPRGTILLRTPYNKNSLAPLGFLFSRSGWSIVVQDMRGRFASEGIDTIFRNDSTDGSDTLLWIANQSWSNGKIATFGPSALGIAQFLMAGENPPNLVCQYIDVATPNLYDHAVYQGGAFRKKLVEGWLKGQGSLDILPDFFIHENYTDAFWGAGSLQGKWQNVNVAAIHVGGWYDVFQQGTLDGFCGYQYHGGPGAQGNSKLIMGPWSHTTSGLTQQGQLKYPENAVDWLSINLFVEMLNQHMLNQSSSFDSWPAVSYYVMGDVTRSDAVGNEWRFADDWPIPHTETSWYFQNDGFLLTTPPQTTDPLTFVYDPNDPVPTIGGQNLNMPAGPFDQSGVEIRDDVILFTSPILDRPYEATGRIRARLFVSSDCPDTDFTVKLTDVYPDGRSMLITDGILRMRNRNGSDHWEFMQPGTVYEVEVDLWSTSYVWDVGHRIRVSVSSSNYPRFLNNPNTVDGTGMNTSSQVAHNTVYMNSSYPSCLILPEIVYDPLGLSPEKPSQPSGRQMQKTGKQYVFTSMVSDPEGDNVSLVFDWGDGSWSGWLGPVGSGEPVQATYWWRETGSYQVRVKAKDSQQNQSPWSDPLLVVVTQGNPVSRHEVLTRIGEKDSLTHKIVSLMLSFLEYN